MIEVAEAINSFAPVAQQADVSPSEESVFVLSGSQLQEIISRAVQDATEPLYREIALDRQRITRLEQREPQPLQKDRGEILKALITANSGKMLAKEARQKMHLSRSQFSMLLATMKEDIEVRPYHLRKNQRILVLK
jgi:cytoskeletal protein RodZ